ncbi:hypothetical protein [Zooshikella ganghwensis]|uniref:hypothetical protein n=1 Tax=Zooshikella ganghwensis TaxID=202772 RepID=UPI000402E26C|nr:hypothetical protein [Zooshikella ganghwensis]
MEINTCALTRKNTNTVNKINTLIDRFKEAKNKLPPRITISKVQQNELEANLRQYKCFPPYTLRGIPLVTTK